MNDLPTLQHTLEAIFTIGPIAAAYFWMLVHVGGRK